MFKVISFCKKVLKVRRKLTSINKIQTVIIKIMFKSNLKRS